MFAGILLLYLGTTISQEPDPLVPIPESNARVLMQVKLNSTQRIVEGLVMGDYRKIELAADTLAKVCDSSNWRRLEDEAATQYRLELARSAKQLREFAQASQNSKQASAIHLNACSSAFNRCLATCVNCHDYSRVVLGNMPVQPAAPRPVPR